MSLWKQVLVAFTLLFSIHTHAALIDQGLITQDTRTGIEWLDLTETAGLTFNYVSAQLGAGGAFEGWRYATVDEVEGYFDSAGGNGIYDLFLGDPEQDPQVVSYLLGLWGTLGGDGLSIPIQSGFILDMASATAPEHRSGLIALSDPSRGLMLSYQSLVVADDEGYPSYGHALVRVVPLPPAFWLFTVGLLMLFPSGRCITLTSHLK